MNAPAGESATQKLYDSLTGVVLDKIVSFFFGVAGVVLASVIFPLAGILFGVYAPVTDFLTEYVEYCLVILLITAVTWALTLWKGQVLALVVHACISAIALAVSGMMRLEMGLPSVVRVQFLLYFAGIVIVCEMLAVAFTLATWKAVKFARSK